VLGFVEGEGSFYVAKRSYTLAFSITQSSRDLTLMENLKNYLANLSLISCDNNYKIDAVKLNTIKKSNQPFNVLKLVIEQELFLQDYVIPFFNTLTWRTKKKRGFEY